MPKTFCSKLKFENIVSSFSHLPNLEPKFVLHLLHFKRSRVLQSTLAHFALNKKIYEQYLKLLNAINVAVQTTCSQSKRFYFEDVQRQSMQQQKKVLLKPSREVPLFAKNILHSWFVLPSCHPTYRCL